MPSSIGSPRSPGRRDGSWSRALPLRALEGGCLAWHTTALLVRAPRGLLAGAQGAWARAANMGAAAWGTSLFGRSEGSKHQCRMAGL